MRALVAGAVLLAGTACSSSGGADAFCDAVRDLERLRNEGGVSVAWSSDQGGEPEGAGREAEAEVRAQVEEADSALARVSASAPSDLQVDARTAVDASRRYLAWLREHDYDPFAAVSADRWISDEDAATARAAAVRVDSRTRADCDASFHLLPAGTSADDVQPPPTAAAPPPAPPAPPDPPAPPEPPF